MSERPLLLPVREPMPFPAEFIPAELIDPMVTNAFLDMEAIAPKIAEHCNHVAALSYVFGRHYGLSQEDLFFLYNGARIHDIGEALNPGILELIQNPKRKIDMTPYERRLLESHPQVGDELLSIYRISQYSPSVLHHHEKWDGSGYPDRLQGQNIPLFARIISMWDYFDAGRRVRSYKPAWSLERAHENVLNGFEYGIHDPNLQLPYQEIIDLVKKGEYIIDGISVGEYM